MRANSFFMDSLKFQEYCQNNILDRWNCVNPELFDQEVQNDALYVLDLFGDVKITIPIKLAPVVKLIWSQVDKSQFDQYNDKDVTLVIWLNFLRAIFNVSLPTLASSFRVDFDLNSSIDYLLKLGMVGLLHSLDGENIHVRLQHFADRVEFLAVYFSVLEHLKCHYSIFDQFPVSDVVSEFICERRKSSALFNSAKGSFCAVFGGQGPQFFKELVELYRIYPIARQIVNRISTALFEQSQNIEAVQFYHPYGFNLRAWIEQLIEEKFLTERDDTQHFPVNRIPNEEFILTAPISCPLIYLTQMLNYVILCQEWDANPGQVAKCFNAVTGHSQGLIAALTLSISKSPRQLIENIVKGCLLMQWFGIRMQQQTPNFYVPEQTKLECATLGLGGAPKCLLSIKNIPYKKLMLYIEKINVALANFPDYKIELSLLNGVNVFVVVGHPVSLQNLVTLMSKTEILSDGEKHDQNRVPYSKRKIEFVCRYLDVSVPFHSSLLRPAVSMIIQDAKRLSISYETSDMALPLFLCCDTSPNPVNTFSDSVIDARAIGGDADKFLETIILYQGVSHINWIKTFASILKESTHVIDFGPGGLDGVGIFSSKLLVGSGVHLIINSTMGPLSPSASPWTFRDSLFDSKDLLVAESWAKQYAPTLHESNGKITLRNKYTREYGKPPLLVAGMTPTTVSPDLVSVVLNCGYYCELAGGGLPTQAMFFDAVDRIVQSTPHGTGIVLNLLFLNPRLWARQIEYTYQLCKRGYFIQGVTVAAGIPSLEKANELIASLAVHGVQFVCFKPGNFNAIMAVLEIASANPDFKFILQWTGGRAGGHHSFEDFHEPIFLSYSKIRQLKNITLIAGSGFGDGEHSWPYLSGSWSEAYNFPRMPFDGILFASRMLICREARTCLPVKQLLADTSGVDDLDSWEDSYESVSGGIITVNSELGQPIHVIANRGTLFWRYMDRTFFSIPSEERAAKLEQCKDQVIEKINSDHLKLFFGRKQDGRVCDLSEMTYSEVSYRIVELCYVADVLPARWLHADFARLLFNFLQRTEERLSRLSTEYSNEESTPVLPHSIICDLVQLETDPLNILNYFFDSVYVDSKSILLCTEDVEYFIQLCRAPSRKPANFIPLIDKDLEFWFKKDTLWQSEDIDAIPGRDVGRAFVLQGPVAVRYSKIVDEPVSDVFESAVSYWTLQCQDTAVQSIELFEPVFEDISATWDSSNSTLTFHCTARGADERFALWKSFLCRFGCESQTAWLSLLLQSPNVICSNKMCVKNWIPSLLDIRHDHQLCLHFNATDCAQRPTGPIELRDAMHEFLRSDLQRVSVFDPLLTCLSGLNALSIEYDTSEALISLTLFHATRDHLKLKYSNPVPLKLSYIIQNGCIVENADLDRRVKDFYASIWFGSASMAHCDSTSQSNEFLIQRSDVTLFCGSINRPLQSTHDGKCVAPVDYAIVAGWESIMKLLFLERVEGNMLNLVHLSNSFKIVSCSSSAIGFIEGERVFTNMKLQSMKNLASGAAFTVSGRVKSANITVELVSEFLIRERKSLSPFVRRNDCGAMQLSKPEDSEILKSKEWIIWEPGQFEKLRTNDVLLFQAESFESGPDNDFRNVEFSGKLFKVPCKSLVRAINYPVQDHHIVANLTWHGIAKYSLVSSFIDRHCLRSSPTVPLQKPYLICSPVKHVSPLAQDAYALSSGDMNPIHTNPHFAKISKLPSVIVHGMWSSAVCRGYIESLVASNCPERLVEFKAEFVDVILPGDSLVTRIEHSSMCDGSLIVNFRTEVVERASGSSLNLFPGLVVKGHAKVLGPRVAYVFTGQGSAEVGMGMDLYESSPVAKRIWDLADDYFMNTYRFSIIKIVRENPTQIKISFNGKHGAQVYQNYKRLNEKFSNYGENNFMLLFPNLNENTQFYTFYHKEGLLFATQFSQPALVLTEMAAFENMKLHGLVPPKCIFAGHSLGEYAALASVASVLSIKSLAETVFLRGMTMQSVVERDSYGCSSYAMIAVNPSRVHALRAFRQAQLQSLIEKIVALRPQLLQIVNYNVIDYQYVVAGERGNLSVLTTCLNALNKNYDQVWGNLESFLPQMIQGVEKSRDSVTGHYPLTRGIASLPLNGIDVPFHSTYLQSGVPSFRNILKSRIKVSNVDHNLLSGFYVSNLTARPFSTDREYIQLVYDITGSHIMQSVLDNYENEVRDLPALSVKLLIELLAYQFTSPVRWIQTQDLFFRELHVQRFLEIGPAPTLTTMARRTIETGKYFSPYKRQVLWYGNSKDEIFYNFPDAYSEDIVEAQPVPDNNDVLTTAVPVVQSQVNAPTQSITLLDDVGVDALSFIKSLLSTRFKKPVSAFSDSETITAISAGKSAAQNEVLGELEAEFATKIPDNAATLPLSKLAQEMGLHYETLGKVGNMMVNRLLSNKMPPGVGSSHVKSYLSDNYAIGPKASQSVLLRACTMEPVTRLQTEADAHAFLDTVVAATHASHKRVVSSPTVVKAVSSPSVVAISDESPKALSSILTILSLKTRLPVDRIALNSQLRDIVGGKSALQNELVGDLSKEFACELDGINDLSIQQLAARLDDKYSKTGPVLSTLISRFVANKMPPGFAMSSIRNYLSSKFGLGPMRTDSVLVHALTIEPKSRIASESEAQIFLDRASAEYAKSAGIELHSSAGSLASASSIQSQPSINSAEFKTLESKILRLISGYASSNAEYLGTIANQVSVDEETSLAQAEQKLIVWNREFGEDFYTAIQSLFEPRKCRRYNSHWNWVRLEFLQLYYDFVCGRSVSWSSKIKSCLYSLRNRATPPVLEMITYYLSKTERDRAAHATDFINSVLLSIMPTVNKEPCYLKVSATTRPHVLVDQTGAVNYTEQSVETTLKDYVLEMERGPISGPIYERYGSHSYLSIQSRSASDKFQLDKQLTDLYYSCLTCVTSGEGLSLAGRTALVTGCGRNSIGAQVLVGLLRAGARVYATTSRYSPESCNFYRSLYRQSGAKGSELVLLPFNQASVHDINSLVEYIYMTQHDDLDYLIPFAAIPDNSHDIGSIGASSELAHRAMLVNVIRLIGAIKNYKNQRSSTQSPILVLLPLSFNHGVFGYDGLYSESKLGLETLLNRWYSEDWGDYVSLIGVVIGWTRGTSLMSQNNIVAEEFERLGARTFSIEEMSLNLMALMHDRMVLRSHSQPLLADLNGCVDLVEDLQKVFRSFRNEIELKSSINRLVTTEKHTESELRTVVREDQKSTTVRSNFTIPFPTLPDYSSKSFIEMRECLNLMLDLDNIIVVIGIGEFGPFGSSRTRWEMESRGCFSLEGNIELAWMMGLIKYVGVNPSNPSDPVWADVKSGARVADSEIEARYGRTIREGTGIRRIESHLFDGYDPSDKLFLHQIALNQDLGPIEVGQDEARDFARRHRNHVVVQKDKDSWYVTLKKGATLYVPKSQNFEYFVGGQIPSHWDPSIYGIPQDIINQVDRVTLFTLVSVVESLVAAGVTDPYEFYNYIHVSEFGNTIGGGFGGMQAIKDTYRSRLLDLPVQGDILQETFINTVAAWVNMLLLSSSGPIKTPVGACATAVESVEIGIDTIKTRKARIVIVGGYDDFGEEGSYEFASMKATVNSAEEVIRGRTPREMSRPSTDSRAGFVESHGAGVQILTTAALAVSMGAPIYAILESASTATDKTGRSVPAPGQGILVTARESNSTWDNSNQNPHPLLNLDYRKRHLSQELQAIDQWERSELEALVGSVPEDHISNYKTYIREQSQLKRRALYSLWSHDFYINNPAISPLRGALSVYGLTVDDIQVASFHGTGTKANDVNECQVLQKQLTHLGRTPGNVIFSIFQKSLTGHPKGAAAAWMLNGLIQSMLSGIVPGNFNADNIDPKLEEHSHVVFLDRPLRTYGYRAALLKSFGFGQVGGEILIIHPDYVFSQLDESQFAEYSRKRHLRQQKSNKYWQDSLAQRSSYVKLKNTPPYTPQEESNVYLNPLARTLYDPKDNSWKMSNRPHSLTATDGKPPAPTRNVHSNRRTSQVIEPLRSIPQAEMNSIRDVLYEMSCTAKADTTRGVGVDVQFIPEIELCISSDEFVNRNFTADEIEYCKCAPDPVSSFAGKWAAKEAVFKAIFSSASPLTNTPSTIGPGSPMKIIEICSQKNCPPQVRLHGHALDLSQQLSISTIKATISHSGDYAIAQAFAFSNTQ